MSPSSSSLRFSPPFAAAAADPFSADMFTSNLKILSKLNDKLEKWRDLVYIITGMAGYYKHCRNRSVYIFHFISRSLTKILAIGVAFITFTADSPGSALLKASGTVLRPICSNKKLRCEKEQDR
jgi:hypothetical protein